MGRWLTSLTDAVLVVRVVDKRSSITSAGDWITSTVTADVDTVISTTRRLRAARRQRLTLVESGGMVTVKGHPVFAVVPWKRPHVVGSSYLVFATAGERRGQIIAGISYEVQPGGTLQEARSTS